MASIIENYTYDIFISYRQKDNKGDRWVSEFVETLMTELESTFKEEVSVYFDINPHDGLLETHDVNASLRDKLKCLVFIPIISRTYCDSKSFAWEHEFKAFIKQASEDKFGLKVRLSSGNITSRILPIQIHDLDADDKRLLENELGGFIRGIEFIYKEPGVNRPLRSNEDNPNNNLNHTIYRNQVNKVALAVKEIIGSIQFPIYLHEVKDIKNQAKESELKKDYSIEGSGLLGKKAKSKIIFTSFLGIAIITFFLILGFYGFKFYKKQYARNNLIPEIQKLLQDNIIPPPYAYELATEADKYISNDSILINLWSRIGYNTYLKTQPEGAHVYWKDFDNPNEPWKLFGITPLKKYRIPYSYIRIKIEKEGFQPINLTSHETSYFISEPDTLLKLDSIGVLPVNMIRVPGRKVNINGAINEAKLVGEFLIDRFEVTNEEYKSFVEKGGYNNKSYWNYPIYSEGKEITWDSAMILFIDRTGRQGPAGWEVGNYPTGEENYPVAGISWYEASAYASFIEKKLPTIYHWCRIAETLHSMNIVQLSNFNGKSTVPVGSLEGISSYGVYDLAGNVREWCYNGNGERGENYIVGGGWNDPPYTFSWNGTQPSLDRSLSNGFRCMKELADDTTTSKLSGFVIQPSGLKSMKKPVDDETFNIFLRQYAYDKTDLNAKGIIIKNNDTWKIEKISMDAGYNNERLIVYLFLPQNLKPPYQPIIYFPGSNVIGMKAFSSNYLPLMYDFFVKSGRALVYPILKGTFERSDELRDDSPAETVFYKDHIIMWRKDIGRTIDYLETRNDIFSDKIGYYGLSWGGWMGGLIPAVERRIKVVVLNVGGLIRTASTFSEVDQINFIPRVYQPVLMLNGKYDMIFPEESSQIPMFELLGTPEKDKKRIVYNSGHLVPQTELIKETLDWFDKYLGPVR